MSRLPAPENPVAPISAQDPAKEKDSDSIGSLEGSPQPHGTLDFVSSIRKDEPIVTRRELWSYYSSFCSFGYIDFI